MGVAGAVWAADPAGQPQRILTSVHADPQSGKLVRKVIVSSKAVGERKAAATAATSRVPSAERPESQPAGLEEAVRVIASKNALPPQLLSSVIKVESNYNPLAVSSKGALGLMQLIPSTARRFGVANVFNPVENIEGGAKYLRYLLDLYNGNYPLALAAYNAGEQAVAKYGGVPPYAETQNYLVQVGKQLQAADGSKLQKAANPKGNPTAGGNSKPAAPVPARIVEIHEPDGTVRYVSQ